MKRKKDNLEQYTGQDLRMVFEEFMELDPKTLTLGTKVESGGYEFTLRDVIGSLWNCSDMIPINVYDDVIGWLVLDADEEPIQTYAAVVRVVKKFLEAKNES